MVLIVGAWKQITRAAAAVQDMVHDDTVHDDTVHDDMARQVGDFFGSFSSVKQIHHHNINNRLSASMFPDCLHTYC